MGHAVVPIIFFFSSEGLFLHPKGFLQVLGINFFFDSTLEMVQFHGLALAVVSSLAGNEPLCKGCFYESHIVSSRNLYACLLFPCLKILIPTTVGC